MTATAVTADGRRVLAPRTVRAYAGDWALFTDWCHATGNWELPADPATLVAFLTDCPAAPATLRRRVAAIDHHHTANGHPPPGRSAPVLAARGRPIGEPPLLPAETASAVETALRALPSHGWTRGMFGRRDRCLLVLSQLAGVPYKHLATLTVGDVTVADGGATIENPADAWTVVADPDPVTCAPCAVTRWLRILNLVVTRPSHHDIAQALKKAKPATCDSPHLCHSPRGLDATTLVVPLLPPIDQWGYPPFPVQRLTPHSLSRRVRDLLNGDLGAHRDLSADFEDETELLASAPAPVPRAVYRQQDWQTAWARRQADLQELTGVNDQLDEVDTRAHELNRRAVALLDTQSDSQQAWH